MDDLAQAAAAMVKAAETLEKAAKLVGGGATPPPPAPTWPGNVKLSAPTPPPTAPAPPGPLAPPSPWPGKAQLSAPVPPQFAPRPPGSAPPLTPPASPGPAGGLQADAEQAARARSVKALDAFTRAVGNPVKALDDLAASNSRLAPAALAASAAMKTFGLMRGAYGWAQGVMERGNPNMAGQMQGTVDLVNNRVAGILSPVTQQVNAGIQGLTDGKPGASWGAAIGSTVLGTLGAAVGFMTPVPGGTAIGMGIGTSAGAAGGSAIGARIMGESALPSMAGLPQPSMGSSATDWYDRAMMTSLSLQPGTVEAENANRQLQLLERQIGLLTEVVNNTRGTVPGYR